MREAASSPAWGAHGYLDDGGGSSSHRGVWDIGLELCPSQAESTDLAFPLLVPLSVQVERKKTLHFF